MRDYKAKDIMTAKVLTVTPETSVKDLAAFLLKNGISGAPVMSQDTLVGVVTEDDLIFRDANLHLPTAISIFDSIIYLESTKRFDHELHKVLGGKVADIMSMNPITVTPETTLQAMATIMHEQKKHLLPVLDQGRLVGIVGKADLVRAIAQEE